MKRTEIIAHRGAAGLWPENSMTAIQKSADLAVDGIEVDVHLSRDDEVMIIHDASLERTTAGRGPVRAHTRSELKNVDVTGCQNGVPHLHDLLDVWAPSRRILSIELKNDVDGNRYPGLAEKVAKAVLERDLGAVAFIHAFDWAYLDEVRTVSSHLALGANVERRDIDAHNGLYAILDKLAAMKVRDINVDHRFFDAALIASAHERGLRVTLWTVNDSVEIERALKAGVDTICTDRPDRALRGRDAFLREIGCPSMAPVVAGAPR